MISDLFSMWFRVLVVAAFSLSTVAFVASTSAASSDPPEAVTQQVTVISRTPTEPATKGTTSTRDPDDLSWHSIDGGGGVSASGGLSLIGAIGQPESGPSAAGTQLLAGGLWASSQTSHIFSDSFESGSTIQWSNGP